MISRIRTGKRQPTDVVKLGGEIATYVVVKYSDENSKAVVAELLSCEPKVLSNIGAYRDELLKWLVNNENVSEESSIKFLKSLNDFNLDDYIEAIHFNDIKIPTVPFTLPGSKTYYGISQMRQGMLDFFKTTVLSPSNEPIFICDDMPMEDMTADKDFAQKMDVRAGGIS